MGRRLAKRVICITGAGRGLGAAMAREAAAEGASLVLAARSAEEIDALASELPDAIAVQTDVRLVDDVERMIDAAVAEYGRLDVLINNAGVATYGPLEDMRPFEIADILDTNVRGLILCAQAALRVMRRQRAGLIINIAAALDGRGFSRGCPFIHESVYSASKWAVSGFSSALRQEAAAAGVRVSCVYPGGIDTAAWKSQEFLPFPDHIDPERDFLRPEDVAQRVLELATQADRVWTPELVLLPLIAQG